MRVKFLFLALVFGLGVHSWAGCDEPFIKNMIEQTSKTLPSRMDDRTTLISAGCYSDVLMYKYIINDTDEIKYSNFNDKQVENFARERAVEIANIYCTAPEMLNLQSFIRGIKFLYSTQDGKTLADVVVKNSDCVEKKIKDR